jgi:hypothetical protein
MVVERVHSPVVGYNNNLGRYLEWWQGAVDDYKRLCGNAASIMTHPVGWISSKRRLNRSSICRKHDDRLCDGQKDSVNIRKISQNELLVQVVYEG